MAKQKNGKRHRLQVDEKLFNQIHTIKKSVDGAKNTAIAAMLKCSAPTVARVLKFKTFSDWQKDVETRSAEIRQKYTQPARKNGEEIAHRISDLEDRINKLAMRVVALETGGNA